MKQPHEMRAGNRYARELEERRTLGDLIERKAALVAICRRCKHGRCRHRRGRGVSNRALAG